MSKLTEKPLNQNNRKMNKKTEKNSQNDSSSKLLDRDSSSSSSSAKILHRLSGVVGERKSRIQELGVSLENRYENVFELPYVMTSGEVLKQKIGLKLQKYHYIMDMIASMKITYGSKVFGRFQLAEIEIPKRTLYYYIDFLIEYQIIDTHRIKFRSKFMRNQYKGNINVLIAPECPDEKVIDFLSDFYELDEHHYNVETGKPTKSKEEHIRDWKRAKRKVQKEEKENIELTDKENAAFKLAKKEAEKITKEIDISMEIKANKHSYTEIDPSGSRYETLCNCLNVKKEPCKRILEIDNDILRYKFQLLKIIKGERENVANILSEFAENYIRDV